MAWKNLVLIGSMTILVSGCNQINSLINKLPFVDSSKKNQQTEENETLYK